MSLGVQDCLGKAPTQIALDDMGKVGCMGHKFDTLKHCLGSPGSLGKFLGKVDFLVFWKIKNGKNSFAQTVLGLPDIFQANLLLFFLLLLVRERYLQCIILQQLYDSFRSVYKYTYYRMYLRQLQQYLQQLHQLYYGSCYTAAVVLYKPSVFAPVSCSRI